MIRRLNGWRLPWICLLATVWIGTTVETISAQEQKPHERIKRAIEQLGADSFNDREAAQGDLLKLADADDPGLIAAAESKNIEVSRRAQFVLQGLKKRDLQSKAGKLNWDELAKRIAHHAESDDWKAPGWKDEVIEGALQALLDQINPHVPSDPLSLPRTVDGTVATVDPAGALRRGANLVIGRGFQNVSADRSVVLVDGWVNASGAKNSIIIATGGVRISHCSGCIVIAGEFIDVSNEGSNFRMRREGEEARRSLMMSGGPLHMSHAAGTVLYTPLAQRNPHSNCVFVNTKVEGLDRPPPGGGEPSSKAENVKLGIVPKAMPNKIAGQLNVKQLVERGDSTRAFVIFEVNGVETVVRPGNEIRDNEGKPVPALAGWKLLFVADQYALFSNGKEYSGFELRKQ